MLLLGYILGLFIGLYAGGSMAFNYFKKKENLQKFMNKTCINGNHYYVPDGSPSAKASWHCLRCSIGLSTPKK